MKTAVFILSERRLNKGQYLGALPRGPLFKSHFYFFTSCFIDFWQSDF